MADSQTYPEHEKLAAIQEQSQTCGEFVEWLANAKDIHLLQRAVPCDDNEFQRWTMAPKVEELLAEFFGIDLVAIEAEKRQMLDEIRARARV